MAATASQIAQLRRMCNDVDAPQSYSDATLSEYIERYPLLDALGRDPYQVAASLPPVLEDNPDWTATYDINAAAADIWEEKSAGYSVKFDFSEDGQSFSRSQMFEQCMKMARFYRSRRSAKAITLWPYPRRNPTADIVGNSEWNNAL